jgi:catechol 2,3-dioxygenase-like lactoylglutathione lyase family enzyme
MIKSYNHTSFEVSDMERSVTFYTEVMDMELLDISFREPPFSEKVTGIEGVKLKIAYLMAGGVKLELIQFVYKDDNARSDGHKDRSTHICYNVTNLLSFYKENRDRVNFMCEPLKIPGGPNKNGYMAYLFDPDNNKIELIEPPEDRVG